VHRGLALDPRHRAARGPAPLRGNDAGVMAALRTAAMNLLRLSGSKSIPAGLQGVMHDITAVLAMALRQTAKRNLTNTLNKPWRVRLPRIRVIPPCPEVVLLSHHHPTTTCRYSSRSSARVRWLLCHSRVN
jgi:hypothetical protein